MGLLALFPHEVVRPAQEGALEIIARMFTERTRFAMIEAPPGVGKSALAVATARYAATLGDEEFGPGAYILTPYNNLAGQITGDFRSIGLTALKGRRHYNVKSAGTYENARADFLESCLGVTSYAYFLRARHLPERQVLILDEAHHLERVLHGITEFTITPQICRSAAVDALPRPGTHEGGRIVDWLGAVLLPALRHKLSRSRESNSHREWEDLARRIAEYTDVDDRSQWIVWTDQGYLYARPLAVTAQARELFARARHVLIQSTTIFDFTAFRRLLDIPDSAITFSAPSDFPLRNRPIIYKPAGNMSRSTIHDTFPNLCRRVERIIDDFSQSKGIIHTHSYSINRRLAQHLTGKYGTRIITHDQNPRSREDAIQRHCSNGGPSVLVSPGLTEGLDFKDDLARFQIVCKVPYPRLNAYTRARSARDRSWYQLQTAWALVQMIGRAVRSDTDFATTFILDSHFETFVSRNKGILPGWWLDAIQVSHKAS